MSVLYEEIESPELSATRSGLEGKRNCLIASGDLAAAAIDLMGFTANIGGTAVIIGAQTWPGVPFLIVDSFRLVPHGQWQASNWATGVVTNKIKLEVTYKTLPWGQQDDDNSDNPEDLPFISQELDFGCEILTVPMKVEDTFEQTTFPYNSVTTTREVKRHIRIPTIVYKLTAHNIASPDWAKFADYNGTLNSKVFCKGDPGTVLMNGLTARRDVKWLAGGAAWTIGTEFIYNKHGWNNMLHPDTLAWVPAAALQGGNQPYPDSRDHSQLFK